MADGLCLRSQVEFRHFEAGEKSMPGGRLGAQRKVESSKTKQGTLEGRTEVRVFSKEGMIEFTRKDDIARQSWGMGKTGPRQDFRPTPFRDVRKRKEKRKGW